MSDTLGVLLFPDFEILDVFGPLEMFAALPDQFNIVLIAEKPGLIQSAQGVSVQVEASLDAHPALDILFVPGGMGTRREVNNTNIIQWIKNQSQSVSLILSVCTGAALLAKAGVLNHRKATSNKLAWDWVIAQNETVNWVRKARWVDDGDIITSSGIAAGMDMSLYVIAKLLGRETALAVCQKTEYVWNDDAMDDPFCLGEEVR